jgi:uncharacterized protein
MGDNELAATARTTLRRRRERGSRDRTTIEAILDEALVCHVGLVEDGFPVVIPASPWRVGGWLYLHGAPSSRLITHVGSGKPVCVSVAIVDAIVFARSAMRHSNDFRSVMLFGQGELVEDPSHKTAALAALIDKLSPGRSAVVRPPDEKELGATGVVRLAITEGTAKIRSAPPAEVEKDASWEVWTGVAPLAVRVGPHQPTDETTTLPAPRLPDWLTGE